MNATITQIERLDSVECARLHEGELLVVPTETGWDTLVQQGKQALIDELSDILAPAAAAEQGRWRFVRRLPATGGASSHNSPLHPRWEELDRTNTTWLGEAAVRENLAVLEGHFPDEPVVPGLAQLLWADTLSRRNFNGYTGAAAIRNLKFVRLVVPGVRLRVRLVHETRNQCRVAFTFTSDAGTHSSGVLVGP